MPEILQDSLVTLAAAAAAYVVIRRAFAWAKPASGPACASCASCSPASPKPATETHPLHVMRTQGSSPRP